MLDIIREKFAENRKVRIAAVSLGALLIAGGAFWAYRLFSSRPVPTAAVADPAIDEMMKAETTADSRIYFDQSAVTAKSGERFSVVAMVDPGVNRVSGIDLEVNYDPKKLKLESIMPSDVFSLNLRNPKIDGAKGLGSIALGVPLESSSVGQSAAIATLTFRALQSTGTAAVAFSGNTLIAADHEPGNVAKEKLPVTVTLGPSGQ